MNEIDTKINDWVYMLEYGESLPFVWREAAEDMLIQLKECREKSEHLFNDLLSCWPKAWGWDGEISTLVQQMDRHIERRTKETCFKAGWAWIQDDFGEQFGYDPTDDTDKEDFKQAIYGARVE